ncbi:hypothetical protein BQ8420_15415 [Nocardiopsis sp. JB363]|nr:hypothetical protein BQ8420_15415 [Nocardiopsis sp. JB363]
MADLVLRPHQVETVEVNSTGFDITTSANSPRLGQESDGR